MVMILMVVQLRRFITLIDALYEGRVRVHVYAEGSAMELLNISADEKNSCVHDEVRFAAFPFHWRRFLAVAHS
jgi:predicted ATPase